MTSVYIGEVVKQTGATERAIRLYESLGLMSIARSGKYRIYTPRDIEFVRLIRDAQELGIKLSEITALKNSAGNIDWRKVHDLLKVKQHEVEIEIMRLQGHKQKILECQSEIESCFDN